MSDLIVKKSLSALPLPKSGPSVASSTGTSTTHVSDEISVSPLSKEEFTKKRLSLSGKSSSSSLMGKDCQKMSSDATSTFSSSDVTEPQKKKEIDDSASGLLGKMGITKSAKIEDETDDSVDVEPTLPALHEFQEADVSRKKELELAMFYKGKPSEDAMSSIKMSLAFGDDNNVRELDSITDQEATQFLAQNGIKACGDTAKSLMDVYLGGQSETFQTAFTTWTTQAKSKEVDTKDVHQSGDIILGMGVSALQEQIESATKPMYVRVQIVGADYGHAYTLEVLPKSKEDDPSLGFMHQSFFGNHSMTEWSEHMGSKPIDLKRQHTAKLDQMLSTDDTQEAHQAYETLFLRQNEHLEAKDKKNITQVRVVFAMTPFDPSVAQQNLTEMAKKFDED